MTRAYTFVRLSWGKGGDLLYGQKLHPRYPAKRTHTHVHVYIYCSRAISMKFTPFTPDTKASKSLPLPQIQRYVNHSRYPTYCSFYTTTLTCRWRVMGVGVAGDMGKLVHDSRVAGWAGGWAGGWGGWRARVSENEKKKKKINFWRDTFRPICERKYFFFFTLSIFFSNGLHSFSKKRTKKKKKNIFFVRIRFSLFARGKKIPP